MSELRVAGIVSDSITDGPGLRLALFMQGCPRRCEGCHNPEAHPFDGGQVMRHEQVLAQIDKNPLLTGVTLTGGEPFSQAAALLPVAEGVRQKGLELAAYTGYLYEDLLKDAEMLALLKLCHVLVDGEFILAQRTLAVPFKGSKNQRIIDVPRSLERGEAVLKNDGRWQKEIENG